MNTLYLCSPHSSDDQFEYRTDGSKVPVTENTELTWYDTENFH